MSSSRVLARSASAAFRSDVCAFCHTRQLLPINRACTLQATRKGAQPYVSRRGYAQKLDVKKLRADVDKRGRVGWYKLNRGQKILLVEPDVAEAIYNDFVAHKDQMQYGKLIKQLMKKYNVSCEKISGLAIMTFLIPDLSDAAKRAMLPPSPHKTIAGQMLQGCAEIEDGLAIKHILTAVYLTNYTTNPGQARDIAALFPRSAIQTYRAALPTLKIANQDDPEALTLSGLFFEQEGKQSQALALYEKALQIPWVFQYSAQARHPAQLPIPQPWNSLGFLLKSSSAAERRDRAKWAFEQGAKKGDDPLSCFEYASLLDSKDAEWLKFMSKAAASGHREAMVLLARFYRQISESASQNLSAGVKGALDWLLSWREGSAGQMAVEWYEAAGKAGDLGALMELAEWYGKSGEKGKAKDVLQRIVEMGAEAGEEFRQVVHVAKGILSGIRTV